MKGAAFGNTPKDDPAHNASIKGQDPKHPPYLNAPKHVGKIKSGVANVEDVTNKK